MFASPPSGAIYPNGYDDHVHPIASENGEFVPRVDFDYSALDPQAPEPLIPLSQATSGVTRILDWATELRDLKTNGARIAALSLLLGSNSQYRSLAQIARDAGVSRAIISRWLMQLRDSVGLKMTLRGTEVREHCRQAQNALVAAGQHASVRTRGNPRALSYNCSSRKNGSACATTHENLMNTSTEPKTLDAAKQRIRTLEAQLAGRSESQPGKTATKPGTASVPPRLEDLSLPELQQVLDESNRRGNSELVGVIYREINRRRN
jgi:hypothetical protein